jgi:hypothetical protein
VDAVAVGIHADVTSRADDQPLSARARPTNGVIPGGWLVIPASTGSAIPVTY